MICSPLALPKHTYHVVSLQTLADQAQHKWLVPPQCTWGTVNANYCVTLLTPNVGLGIALGSKGILEDEPFFLQTLTV